MNAWSVETGTLKMSGRMAHIVLKLALPGAVFGASQA